MALCTLLSMPAYILFWSGNILNNPEKKQDQSFSLTNSLAAVSLANLGEKATVLLELDLSLTD